MCFSSQVRKSPFSRRLILSLEGLVLKTTKLFIGVVEGGGFLAGDGLQLGYTGELLLVEHGSLTAHEAVELI